MPIMGGGNGAGAVPLSQIYETVTGDKAANYYSFAITILPTIFGVVIHQFAYMIIFVAIAAALGIVPDNVLAAAKKLQSFLPRT